MNDERSAKPPGTITLRDKLKFTGVKNKEIEQEIFRMHMVSMNRLVEAFPNFNFDDFFTITTTVKLNKNMRTCAGRYKKRFDLIELNYNLHMENPGEFIPTYIHELAHAVTRFMYGRGVQSHGHQWRSVMAAMGQKPEVYHAMDTSKFKRKHRRFKYSCECRDNLILTSVRHNKYRRGKASYSCRSCKASLCFEEEVFS